MNYYLHSFAQDCGSNRTNEQTVGPTFSERMRLFGPIIEVRHDEPLSVVTMQVLLAIQRFTNAFCCLTHIALSRG